MRHKKLMAAGILGLGDLTLVALRAQQKPTLTAMDYIQIQRSGDQYVKTSAGWRIRKRTHVRNKAWSNPLLQSADLN